MAQPVKWGGENRILGAPPGMDDQSCSSLPVFTNEVTCVSCWELTEEELAEVVRTRRVFISVFSGHTQPPVFVGSESEVHRMIADYGAWKLR